MTSAAPGSLTIAPRVVYASKAFPNLRKFLIQTWRQVLCPIVLGITAYDEKRVQQGFLGVVTQRVHRGIRQDTTRLFDNALRRRRIPLRSGTEPYINIGLALRHQARLEGAAHGDDGVVLELF